VSFDEIFYVYVRHLRESFVKAMKMALKAGELEAAQLVAGECVVLAETKDHMNWELIGKAAKKTKGAAGKTLKKAYQEVENEEDEHIYHSKGRTRELWIAQHFRRHRRRCACFEGASLLTAFFVDTQSII